MARSVPEWIGKNHDSKVPPAVRLRIFRREDGICHLTGRKIQAGEKWQLDHRKPLFEDGEHRESNLFPALEKPHRAKSAAEVKRRAKADAAAKRNLGIRAASQKPIKSAPFPMSPRSVKRARSSKTTLRPRRIYEAK